MNSLLSINTSELQHCGHRATIRTSIVILLECWLFANSPFTVNLFVIDDIHVPHSNMHRLKLESVEWFQLQLAQLWNIIDESDRMLYILVVHTCCEGWPMLAVVTGLHFHLSVLYQHIPG